MSCCTTNDIVAVEMDDKNLAASGVLATTDDDDTHINARSHTTYTPGDEGEFFWSGEGAVTKVGTVWGSGPYTAHSNIVLAALHAGAVQRGKPDVKQYFHVERIVASCVLMYHESEHYGVISKRCGYHPLGAVMITGATRFPRMRRLREFVVNRIEPFFPDIGVDLLFECVVIPLPPTTALDAPNEGAEEVPSSQLMLPTNADAGSQSSSYVSSKVSKKTKSRTKEEKNLVLHHNSLCYVDTVRMKAMRDKVSGHPDENTPELQSWYQMTERITVLLKQDEENEDIDKNKTDDDDDDSSLSKKGKRVFLFRLAWSNDVTKHNMSADAIDVDSDVRITSAKGCMDGFRLVITFAIGAALGFVPIFDVLSDVVTTVEFITTANYLWFYVSLAILVNSMRFVTAFHVMDPEPNWGNLVITLIPFAHIAKLPFITEVEVKEKDKTLTLAKKFSSSTVDKVLLVDRTAAKISANSNNFVTMVRAAPTRNLAGLFHEDSLPLNFYDDIDDDAGADGEDVVPTLSPQQQDPHHPHNSSSEDDDVDPLGGFQRRPSPPAAVLSGGALSNYMTNITHDASLRIHILSPEENHQRHPVEQNTAFPVPYGRSDRLQSTGSGGGGGGGDREEPQHHHKSRAYAYTAARATMRMSMAVPEAASFRARRRSVVPAEMPEFPSPSSPMTAPANMASSQRRNNNTNHDSLAKSSSSRAANGTFQDKLVLPLRKVYDLYVEEHSARYWTRPFVGIFFELYLSLASVPVSIYVMIANGVEVTLALLQQRFIGRGKDEPDDIIQRRRHQHVVMAFAEAFSETLPQFAVQVHTYTIGALDPVVFFVSGALTLVSVVKSILTFILQFEDILQLSDSQKILQRSLAENPIQADVWMTLGHYNAPVVLGKEISPAACNMEASHCWVNHFLALHKLTLHRVDYNRDEQHVTLRGHRYERLECFVNAVKGWCRAMALYEKYGNPFVLNKTSEYRTRMALGWYYIASVDKAELEKYVESWFSPQECYQASLELDDANAQAWLGLAKCHGGVVDGVDCNEVMCLKEALHRDADLEDAYMQLGLLLAERLQSNKKHAAATQLNPFGAPHTTEELTIVLIDERVLDATKCFSEVLARNPKNSLAFLNLGKCLLNVEGETSSGAAAATVRGFPHSLDSKSCFVNCLQLDATCAEAYYCLAMSLKEMMTINQSALLLGSNNNTTTVAATTTATIAGKTLSIVDCLVAAIAHDERMKAAYVQLGQHLDNGVTVTITPYRRSSSEEKETQRVFTNQKCFVEAICFGDDSPRVYYHLAECMGATDTVSITRHQAHQPTRRGQRIQRKSEHSLKLTKVQVFAHSIVETSDSMTDDDRASNAVALHFIGSHLHTWGSAASESIPALSTSPMTALDCLVAACDADPLVGRYFESLGDELTRIDAERRPLTVAPQQFTPSIAILHNGVQHSAKDCYVQSAQLDFSRASNLEKLAALMNDTEQLNLRRNYHHPRSGDADDGDDHGVSGGGGGAAAMLLNTMSKLDVLIHLLALQDAPAQTLWSIGNCLRLSSTTTTTTLPPSTSFPVIITTKEGKQFFSALECYVEAVSLNPPHSEAFLDIATLLTASTTALSLGNPPPRVVKIRGLGEVGALECYRQALRCGVEGEQPSATYLSIARLMTGNAPTVLDIGGGVQLTKVGALCKVLELDDTCCEALDCLWRLLPADSSCLTTTEDNGGGTHSSWTRLSCLLRLIHLEHALSSSYYALGQLLEQHNKVSIVTEDGDTFSVEELYLEAIASAEKFIHPDAYCSLGTLRAKAEAQLIPSLDQLEEVLLPDGAKVSAAQCFRHAVACDPTCGVAFYHLGCALGRLDRLVLPVSMATHEEFTVTVGGAADVTELSRSECLQYALTCDPTISGAYFALAEFLVLDDVVEIAGKRYTKQALLLETIHRTTSGSSSSSISGCSRSSDDGRTLAKAFLSLHKSLKDGGGDEAAASLTLLSGAKLTSRDCLVNAIAADNCSGDAFFELGQWLVKRNQTSANSTVQIVPGTPPLTAKQCFICAIERDASNGAAYGALCGLLGDDEIVQMRTGRLTKRDALMEAIYLNPTDESAMRTMLGWIEESAESSFQLKNGEVVTRTSLLALILSVTTDLASTYFDLGIALVSAREPSIQLPKNNITLTPMQCFIESIRYAAPPAEAAASSQAPTTTSRGDAKLLPRAVSRIYDALLRIGTLMKDSDVLTVPDGPYREKFKNLTRVQCFVEAIALNPDHAIGYALVAKTLSSMRFPFKPKHEKKGLSQVECCMKAISLDNSCSTAYFALGKSLKEGATALVDKSKLSRQDCLVRAIEKANDEDNEDDDIVCEAFVALGQALESPTAQVLVGTKLYHQTDCFIKALDTNPRLPDALMERGRALGDRETVSHFGKVLNKKGFIAAAIAGKPDSPFPYYYLGEALVRDQHSLSVSTSALKTSTTTASTAAALPSAKVTRDNRTVSMNAMECFVEAISLMEASILDESIMTSPLHAAAYYQLGLCLTAMADANPSGQSSPPVVHFPKTNTTLTAQECHIEAIHRNPNYAEPYYAVGCLYLKTNENIRLRTKDSKQRDLLTPKECIIKAITLKPTWALPYVRLASTMAAKQSELLPSGPFSKKECLTHALSLDASCGEAYYLLGMTIGNKEQVAVKGMSPLDSRKCFINAITHARTLWAAYYQLGMLLTDNESVTINNEKYQRSQLMKFRDRAFQATSNHTFE